MHPQIEVLYFTGCPNATVVIKALEACGLPFEITIQDNLSMDNAKRGMTSPSVLVNGQQVIGSTTALNSAGCTLFNLTADFIEKTVRSAIEGKQL